MWYILTSYCTEHNVLIYYVNTMKKKVLFYMKHELHSLICSFEKKILKCFVADFPRLISGSAVNGSAAYCVTVCLVLDQFQFHHFVKTTNILKCHELFSLKSIYVEIPPFSTDNVYMIYSFNCFPISSLLCWRVLNLNPKLIHILRLHKTAVLSWQHQANHMSPSMAVWFFKLQLLLCPTG